MCISFYVFSREQRYYYTYVSGIIEHDIFKVIDTTYSPLVPQYCLVTISFLFPFS